MNQSGNGRCRLKEGDYITVSSGPLRQAAAGSDAAGGCPEGVTKTRSGKVGGGAGKSQPPAGLATAQAAATVVGLVVAMGPRAITVDVRIDIATLAAAGALHGWGEGVDTGLAEEEERHPLDLLWSAPETEGRGGGGEKDGNVGADKQGGHEQNRGGQLEQ